MGFLDELKRLTHPYEDEMEDDYDEDEDVYEDEEEPEDVEPTPPPRGSNTHYQDIRPVFFF